MGILDATIREFFTATITALEPGVPAHACKTRCGLKFLRRRLAQIPPAKELPGQGMDEQQGGRGVVVPGCSLCRKRLNTSSQFVDHLANDVLPAAIAKLDET